MPINIKKIKQHQKLAGYTYVDMHVHSKASLDTFADIDKILNKAAKNNFGIAITDHNKIEGSVYAYHNKKNVLVIPGIEVKSYSGIDIIFYFYNIHDLEKFFNQDLLPHQQKNPFINDLPIAEIIKKARQYKCVITAPHPFILQDLGLGKAINKKIIDRSIVDQIDAIEVLNATSNNDDNEMALNWSKELHKRITGGSDSHFVKYCGNILTGVKLKNNENFLDKLLFEDALIIGKPSMFLINVVAFILGHLRILTFPKGFFIVKEHLGICFFLKRRKSPFNAPPGLTYLRMLFLPLIIGFLFWDFSNHFVWAFIIYLFNSFLDAYDGYHTKKYEKETKFSLIWNPLIKKILYVSLILSFLYYEILIIEIIIGLFIAPIIANGLDGFIITKKKLLQQVSLINMLKRFTELLALGFCELYLLLKHDYVITNFPHHSLLISANSLFMLIIFFDIIIIALYAKNIIFSKIKGESKN